MKLLCIGGSMHAKYAPDDGERMRTTVSIPLWAEYDGPPVSLSRREIYRKYFVFGSTTRAIYVSEDLSFMQAHDILCGLLLQLFAAGRIDVPEQSA